MATFEDVKNAADKLADSAKKLATMADEASNNATAEVLAKLPEQVGLDPFWFLFSIFAMACFVGYYVVWSVTPALHTPLMAVTNAISAVIVVGGLIAIGSGADEGGSGITRFFGFIAVLLASVNIFGGFLVTQRMLAMYKKKD